MQILFEDLDSGIMQINENIIRKKPKNGYSYFTPERNFLRVYNGYDIELWLFVGNEKINGVRKVKSGLLKGRIVLNNEYELPLVLSAVKKSFETLNGSFGIIDKKKG
jgi:predicted transport protein